MKNEFVGGLITRFPSVPALVYLLVVGTFCLMTTYLVFDLIDRYLARNGSVETLVRLQEAAKFASAGQGSPDDGAPAGSPFLEGQTITVASAALLQRMTNAISHVGASIISSEVEQQAQSKDGLIKITVTCDLEQEALQRLLHNVEAGMPFLFVDQLIVQGPTEPSEGGRLRVTIGISGLWPGAL